MSRIYGINVKKLLEKQKKLGYSDEVLAECMDTNINTLNEIKNTGIVNDINNYVNVMNVISWQPKAIEQKLNDIRRRKELERLNAEEKRKREEQKAKRRESRKNTFAFRLQEVKEKVKKSKSEVFLKNRKFLIKPANKEDEREYSTGDFVRVPENTDISELTDFYYRFSRSYIVEEGSIRVEPETYLRHIDKSCIGRDNIEYYYNRGDVEVFLRVKEFPQTRKKEEVFIKEESEK